MPIAQVSIHLLRGITKSQIESRLADRTTAFARQTDATSGAEVAVLSEPHLVTAEGPLVSGLLAVCRK